MAFAKTLPGLFVSVLVPNLRGAESAIAAEADLMIVPLSASHAHSLANLRKTPDDVVAEVARIRAARDAAGSKTLIEGGVGTAFGCTIQGQVDKREVLRCMQALLDAGADRVSMADTVGYADPAMVRDLFEEAVKIAGDRFWCGHFHDTRGLGLANVYAALEVGVDPLRRLPGRHRRLPACARRERQRRRPKTWPTCSAAWASTTGIDIDRLLALRAQVAAMAGRRDAARRAVAAPACPRPSASRPRPLSPEDAMTNREPSHDHRRTLPFPSPASASSSSPTWSWARPAG